MAICDKEIAEKTNEDITSKPLELLTGLPGPEETWAQSLYTKISNLELQVALLAIARQPDNCSYKKLQVIKEPDPFSKEELEELQAFVF